MRLQLSDAVRELPWFRQIASRIILLWPLKAVGTSLFMALFFWGYFGVLESPLRAAVVMPVTAVDRWVPFTELALPVYVSLWLYVSLMPALLGSFRALLYFGFWVAALCLFCLSIFWLFPTEVPAAGIDWALYPSMALIKGIDAGGNACPSLHVASAVFVACWFQRMLYGMKAPPALHRLNWAVCLLIVWSTMATRQHVVLDVVAGAAIGLLFALRALRDVERCCKGGAI
ncbi:phosphatase PAP2 family protein [Thauera sp.]|uniref:phosphatase PAP2 family protein n=1 Tax=Thauera sp. TaxID=1905334 RepID=UPI0039E5152B